MTIKKEERYFYTCDGKTLKNLEEMLSWVKQSNDDSFSHHVNQEKNDFSGWVKEVVKDSTLAKKFKKNQKKEAIIKEIEQKLESKSKKKNNKKNIISQIRGAVFNG